MQQHTSFLLRGARDTIKFVLRKNFNSGWFWMDRLESLLLQTVVLLNRQYLLTERLIEVESPLLKTLEVAVEEKEEKNLNHVLDVYNYIFALIDHLVRYRKIAFVLPYVSQKSQEFRSLDAAIGQLKDIRDQFQHINNDIENSFTGPLLGAVCWVSNDKQFLVSFHDIGRSRSSPGIVLDTYTGKYLHEFCYIYNEKYYDLRKAIDGVRVFNRYISSLVNIQIDGKDYNPNEHFVVMGMSFQIPPVIEDQV